MANTPQARKRIRRNDRRAEINTNRVSRIRSFVTRAGRLSPAQARALDELGPQFCLPYQKTPLDTAATFGRSAPVVLEIGFGMGGTTAAIAAAMPGKRAAYAFSSIP